MKKLLTTLTLFVALALTSCGGANNSSASSSSGKHEHTFDETVWESNDNQHWHPATCEHKDAKGSAESHKWVEDTSKAEAATCSKPGKKVEKCSVCGKEKTTDIPTLDHDWEKQKDNAKETGYTQTSQYKCKFGDHYALRFAALDFVDSVDIEENDSSSSNPNSVRLKTAQFDGKDTSKIGSKLVYKIKSGAAAQNVGFSFNAVLKYGSGAPAPLFDYVSGDQQQGYIENAAGELELTTKRYQLKVNDKIIPIGSDEKYGNDITGEAGKPAWYDWPVSFDLVAGDNTIEILCLGGYRAYLYDFQVSGLPANA